MKRLIFFASVLAGTLVAKGQSAITLTQSNFYLSQGKHTVHFKDTANASAPKIGSNQSWDYSTITGGDTFSTIFKPNTNSAFSSSALTYLGLQSLNSTAIYYVDNIFDEDANAFFSPGAHTPYQTYGLGNYTGNPSDTLYVLDQNIFYRENIVAFPATANSTWSSNYKEKVNFKITLSFLGYNKTPASTLATISETNNVVGWGTVKVPASHGSSKDYNVLEVKTATVSNDSFFINNKPASPLVLSGFGMKQGAKSYTYQINFYRTGSAQPLMTFDFGNDSTYTNLQMVSYDTDVETGLTADNKNDSHFSVFPNPAACGSNINCSFLKNTSEPWLIKITNMVGQTVATRRVSEIGNITLPLTIENGQAGGLYFVNMLNEKGEMIASSKLNIVR